MTMLREELTRYTKEIESYLATSGSLGIVLLDSDLIIRDCNLGFMRLFSPRQKPVGIALSDFIELEERDIYRGQELRLPCSRKSGMNGILHCHLIRMESGHMLLCERLLLTESRTLEKIGVINDELLNMQRELVKKNHLQETLKRELDTRITDLEAALDRVKRLEGIISICMYCNKIRNEQESWEKLEKYISDHSDTEFSHGICPDCLEERFPTNEESITTADRGGDA